jgi:hypothetical protein
MPVPWIDRIAARPSAPPCWETKEGGRGMTTIGDMPFDIIGWDVNRAGEIKIAFVIAVTCSLNLGPRMAGRF